MKEIQSTILQYKGSHYDFGKMQGKSLKNSSLFSSHREQLKPTRHSKFTIDVKEAEAWISQFAPALWEELEGLAEGLDIPVHQAAALYSGYQQEWVHSGCSILTTKDIFIRNYDFHPKTYEGRFVIFQPEKGYASIGPAQRITGRTDGMNEKGLVAGYNFVNRRRGGDGFIPTVITRMLLENCASAGEAAELIKRIPHRHTFNFMLYDKEATSYVVEASPRGVQVRERLFSTNHFDLQTDENRYHMSDSVRRAELLEEKSLTELTPEEAFRYFNQKKYKIYSEEYSNWAGTIHTSMYNPKKLEMAFAIGADKFPLVLSFDGWLSGKVFPYKKFRGFLNTDEPLPLIHEA